MQGGVRCRLGLVRAGVARREIIRADSLHLQAAVEGLRRGNFGFPGTLIGQ